MNLKNMNGTLVWCGRNIYICWINWKISDYCLVSTPSHLWKLLTWKCVEDSDQGTLVRGSGENLTILWKLDGMQGCIMTFELLNSFVTISIIAVGELYDLSPANIYMWECKDAIVLSYRYRYDTEWIWWCLETVRAIQMLEIIDVNFLLENHDNSVFSQLNIEDISLEVQLSKWPVLDIIPQNKSVWWVWSILTGAYKADDVCPK